MDFAFWHKIGFHVCGTQLRASSGIVSQDAPECRHTSVDFQHILKFSDYFFCGRFFFFFIQSNAACTTRISFKTHGARCQTYPYKVQDYIVEDKVNLRRMRKLKLGRLRVSTQESWNHCPEERSPINLPTLNLGIEISHTACVCM